MQRLKLDIKGQVQGVGFRPCVYRVAQLLQLTGCVHNHSAGVTVEVQGERVVEFEQQLKDQLPALAKIDSVETTSLPLQQDETEFKIIASQSGEKVTTIITPDVCICKDCLHELFDPKSRFYHYPFLNCTNCGPRLTIVRQLPYDRHQTSMCDFPFCDDCKEDYLDPLNRRYHAQPTACASCGPKLSHSIEEMVKRIKSGEIVSVKGMGGYQLICDARNEEAVTKLRQRKHRDAKPFALMVLNTKSAEQIVQLDNATKELMQSWERPIVLSNKKGEPLASKIAKDLSTFGVMLPYTPIHYLLFHGLTGYPNEHDWLSQKNEIVLVVTSANISGDPLITEDEVANESLKNIADLIVSYNRKIVARADDSVATIINQKPVFIRRARGYVPKAIQLARKIPSGLAVGGLLKNTFCITRGDKAFISQYIGDMDNPATIEFFHETLDHHLHLLDVKPEFIAHDLHPDFYTTRFAQEFGLPSYPVQHHIAHIASVAAEHQIEEPVLGLSLDGYGYGEDGEAWGGELFLYDGVRTKRLGSLKPIPLPGGDKAARAAWRVASGVLHELNRVDEIHQRFGQRHDLDGLIQMLNKKINTPYTSSCGRLFDAASALLGIKEISDYEGEAAMQLESFVTEPKVLQQGWLIDDDKVCLNLLPLFERLLYCDFIEGANLFHGTLVAAINDWVTKWGSELHIYKVLCSGGCFINRHLSSGLIQILNSHGIECMLPQQVPVNDGGLSLGQVWFVGQIYK